MLVVARFALFFHHATESLVLAVRGTSSIKDAISDLMADEASLLIISKCYKSPSGAFSWGVCSPWNC